MRCSTTLGGAGHFPYLDLPQRFNNDAVGFLKSSR